MAEPQIEVRVWPTGTGCFVGWHCWWKGQEYGNAITHLIGRSLGGRPDDDELASAKAAALAAGEATMKEVTDAQP